MSVATNLNSWSAVSKSRERKIRTLRFASLSYLNVVRALAVTATVTRATRQIIAFTPPRQSSCFENFRMTADVTA
jgi:hypothetical protein